jgi:DNA-binding LacI/PurR family transcriptional regulator/AraC-like DNA-binding protein
MLASIHSGSSTKVWPAVIEAAERHRDSLFIFPGGRLGSGDGYEYMRNRIFDLVRASTFDGTLCWASSLAGFTSETDVERYLLDTLDTPLVTFGLKIGDNPVVNMDAYTGMKRLVMHCIKHHGCRNIAYIGGPRAHSSSEERYRAYLDALEESRIPVQKKIVRVDTPWTEGRTAIREILEDRGARPKVDFDALCAASDLLAFEAAKYLQEIGMRIPSDIVLGGFNDSDESNIFSPTYTTVRMPFDRQAAQAFHMLTERIEGKAAKDRILRTTLIIRQSCGCKTESIRLAGLDSSRIWKRIQAGDTVPKAEKALELIRKAGQVASEDLIKYIDPIVRTWLKCLGRGSTRAFIESLDRSLDDLLFKDRDIAMLQDMLSFLRIASLHYAVSTGKQAWLERLIGQGRVMVSDAEKRRSNYRVWTEKSVEHWMNFIGHELMCVKDFPAILGIAAKFFPKLGIPSGYLVLENTRSGMKNFLGAFLPNSSSSEEARILSPAANREQFPHNLLLPDAFMPKTGAFVVLPLYFETTSLGYLVLEMKRMDSWIFEELRAQLSSAMRGILLFEQANEARIRAEKAEKMKSEFLAGISGDLKEPIQSIHDLAQGIIIKGGSSSRKDIEAILAATARQMEMTRHLTDLALAQAGSISLNLALFDPENFIEALGRTQEKSPHDSPIPQRLYVKKHAFIPIMCGDIERLGQIMDIFCGILAREFRPQQIFLGFEAMRAGLRIHASVELCEKAQALKAIEVQSRIEAVSGFLSLEGIRIEVELARRLAFLHSSTVVVDDADDGRRFELSLLLPYPCLEGLPSNDARRTENIRLAGFSTVLPPWLSQRIPALSIDIEYSAISFDMAGSTSLADKGIGLLYLDPESLTAEEALAAGIAVDNPAFGKHPLIVPATLLKTRAEARTMLLADLLRKILPQPGSAVVVLMGMDETTFKALKMFYKKGIDCIQCSTKDELAAILSRVQARSIVILDNQSAAIRSIINPGSLGQVPVLYISRRFDDREGVKMLLSRPQTVLCNHGQIFLDCIGSHIDRMALGGEYLPFASSSTVMKAILYLNRHFRESMSRWKLSEQLNASEDYLSRIFHAQMGISLWEYLNRLRIDYAIELLKGSTESVAEVAYRSGYQDQAYFSRVFKRITGTTPGRIRKG